MSLAFEASPAGQEEITPSQFFRTTYVRLMKEQGLPALEAFALAKEELAEFSQARTEARNDGLDTVQASVVANKVAQENKPYQEAVKETLNTNSVQTKIQAGAIQVEHWVREHLLPVIIGTVLAIAAVVFLTVTKTGKKIAAAAVGAPVKR